MPRATLRGSPSTGRAVAVPDPGGVCRARSPSTSCRSPAPTSTTARSRPTRSRSCATSRRRILHIPDLRVSGTCVRVPVFTGHSLAIHAEFAEDISPDGGARPAEERHPASVVNGCAQHRSRPPAATRSSSAGCARDQAAPEGKGLVLFVVGDNLRKGAATTQIRTSRSKWCPVCRVPCRVQWRLGTDASTVVGAGLCR